MSSLLRSDGALAESIKATPPASVLGAYAAGMHISDWAAAFALLYSLLLIAEKLYNWRKAWKAKHAHRK